MLLPVQPQTNGAKKNAFRCQIKTNRLLDYHFLLKKIVKWKLSFEKCVVTGYGGKKCVLDSFPSL